MVRLANDIDPVNVPVGSGQSRQDYGIRYRVNAYFLANNAKGISIGGPTREIYGMDLRPSSLYL